MRHPFFCVTPSPSPPFFLELTPCLAHPVAVGVVFSPPPVCLSGVCGNSEDELGFVGALKAARGRQKRKRKLFFIFFSVRETEVPQIPLIGRHIFFKAYFL